MKKSAKLTGAAMMSALNVIVHQTTTIIVTTTQQITFYFVAVALTSVLYGPLLGGLSAVVADIIKYILKPNGAYFVGFTFNEFLIGVIYGLFLYKKPFTLLRVFLAHLTVTVVVNMTLVPLWLSILYGKSFMVLATANLIKYAIMLPVGTFLIYFIGKLLLRAVGKYLL